MPFLMKMEGAFQLIAFSVVMLVGSYFAGSIPLFMPMSEEKLQLVSVLGAGLLVGTALAVIIPEGMQTLLGAYTQNHSHEGKEDSSHDHDHLEGIDRAIGVSLVLGFLFMLLIDQLASNHFGSRDVEQGRRTPVNWTTTLGLVVHAAADGIALGAAASTHQVDVEIIVFLAIMLHKAPAAFGLVTFLLHEGLERTRIRKHLLVFALSAPVLAVFTFFALAASDKDTLNTHNATGIAMLFSAGTFLYVATVHVLPEVTSVGSGHSHNVEKATGFSKMELLMLTIGTLLPLLLTLGHHH